MVQPGTGHIIAMTQNREWGTSGKGRTTYNYNAPQSMGGTIGMQAGSTFKVFTLAAALEAGISPNEYISSPSPNTFNNFRNCETGVPYDPVTVRNSTTSGTLNMAQATAYSTNTYFMAIEERTGICRPVDIAESLGVTLGNGDPLLRVPSFTLGTMEIAPLSLANAYATFAAHGRYCEPVPILEIRDRDGAKLNVPNGDCRQVLDRSVADGVTVMLNGVVDGNIPGRTGAPMNLGDRPVAGKTGTTNESAAVWFAGFTPQVASAVWVGDPRGGYAFPLKDVTINGTYYRQVYGGTLAGPIWKASMEAALADKPIEEFVLSTDLPTSVFDVNEIPDITGMATPEEIFAALTKVNLELGEISEEDSPEPAGTVIAQTPEPGGPAVPQTAVDIVVSTGLNTVPESRGAPVQDATTIMERSGYTAEIVLLETATVTPGLVMQQSVPAGTLAPVGSVILLTVSAPPTLVPQPEIPQPEIPQPEIPQPEIPQPAPDPAAPPVEDPAVAAPAP